MADGRAMNPLNILMRLANSAILAEPHALAVVLGVLSDRINLAEIEMEIDGEAKVVPVEALQAEAVGLQRDARQYSVNDGIAHVPIIGSLVQRGRSLRPVSGATSYQAISEQVALAAADDEVRAIALEIDSPGGEVSGAFAAAETIREASSIKPTWAFVNESAMSAAYLLASGASRIIAPRTAQAGSVGAVTVILDQQSMLAKRGIKAHILRSGRYKTKPNPIEGLDDESAERIQARLDETRQDFVEFVTADGRMSYATLMDTEARVFGAAEALEIGMIDEIAQIGEAMRSLDQVSRRGSIGMQKGVRMTTKAKQITDRDTDQEAAEVDAVATTEAAHEQTKQTIVHTADIAKAAVAAERKRIGTILSAEDAKGREELARTLAIETDLDADAALKILRAAPLAAAVAPKGNTAGFDQLMAQVNNPDISATPQDAEDAEAAKMLDMAIKAR